MNVAGLDTQAPGEFEAQQSARQSEDVAWFLNPVVASAPPFVLGEDRRKYAQVLEVREVRTHDIDVHLGGHQAGPPLNGRLGV